MMGQQNGFMKERKRAVLYLRVSTQEQAIEGYSLFAQEKNGREVANRMGYDVVQVYADEGESGKSTKKRKAYQQMMKDAEAEKFDMVIVWKLTRLARNMMDVLSTVETLLEHNIEFHSISEQFDVSTSTGKLMLQLLGSFGEFERNQIAENVQMTMKSLVRDQKRYAGGRRLGYVSGKDSDGKKQLIIEPKEAEIVRLIFSHYLLGEGYRAIANRLNRRGLKTVKGNTFSTSAIKDIVHNKVYGGYIEYARYTNWDTKRRKGKNEQPILVKGTHDPILSEELYHAVQKRLEEDKHHPKWTNRGENLLTGLLRCPECHAPMAASNVTNTLKGGIKKRTRYYSCSTFRNKGAGVCHANSIRADVAEAYVAQRLKEIVQVPEILAQLVESLNQEMVQQVKPLEQELAVIGSQYEELDRKLTNLYQAIEDDPSFSQMVRGRIVELEQQKSELTHREQTILAFLGNQDVQLSIADVQLIVESIDQMVQNQEKSKLKQLYGSFIKEITFDPLDKEHLEIKLLFDEKTKQIIEDSLAPSDTQSDGAFYLPEIRFTLSI